MCGRMIQAKKSDAVRKKGHFYNIKKIKRCNMTPGRPSSVRFSTMWLRFYSLVQYSTFESHGVREIFPGAGSCGISLAFLNGHGPAKDSEKASSLRRRHISGLCIGPTHYRG
jgi:hypothetical protein